MGSLVFLCFLFDGLHENFIAAGVSKESYFVAPPEGRLKTNLYGSNLKGETEMESSYPLKYLPSGGIDVIS